MFLFIQNTSDYASQLYTSYINSSSCCFTGYNTNGSVDDSYCDPSYYRAAVVGGTSPPLYYQPSFNRPVNLSSTSVHIPINVYQRGKPYNYCTITRYFPAQFFKKLKIYMQEIFMTMLT